MAKRSKHVHKYIYQQLSKYNMGWRCALPYCDHFLPRNVEGTIEGRMSLCWECNEEFRLDQEAVKMEMPTCLECRGKGDTSNSSNEFTSDDFNKVMHFRIDHGIKSLNELSPEQVLAFQRSGKLPRNIPIDLYSPPVEVDEIEVIEADEIEVIEGDEE